MADTPTLRNVSDYLWDWAGDEYWKKLLVRTVIDNGKELDEEQRNNVFNHLLNSTGAIEEIETEEINRPTFSPTSEVIELQELKDIKGVNKLSEGATISFAKNITVIYGDNGAGKTGFSRILKSLGYSWDEDNRILPDIFNPSDETSATISYRVNDNVNTIEWNTGTNNNHLKNVSIFNNDCVKISLGNRRLLVSPIGFHLFDVVNQELSKLKRLIEGEVQKYPTITNTLEFLSIGTPQYNFINTLSHQSTFEQLNELSIWNDEKEQKLIETEQKLSSLNKELMTQNQTRLKIEINELDNIANRIKGIAEIINADNHSKITSLLSKIEELKQKDSSGLHELTERFGIDLFGTNEFMKFIDAADKYIGSMDDKNYPSNNTDRCIYCNQELQNDNAIALINSYKQVLNNAIREQLAKANSNLATYLNNINQQPTDIALQIPSFGMNERHEVIQPDELVAINKETLRYQELLANPNNAFEYQFNIDFTKVISKFTIKSTKKKEELIALEELITNTTDAEKKILSELNELKDCKTLHSKKSNIETIITNLKKAHKINACLPKVRSNSLSIKTTQARDELIAPNFERIFRGELQQLRKSHIEIELNFATDRGVSNVNQTMQRRYSLAEILSEGEQKAIALSEFLTELQLESSRAPIVFDDPVNSLDHKIIDDVAKRLMAISRDRQVVVFTHSILLYNSFLNLFERVYNKLGCDAKFINVRAENGVTGLISEGEEREGYNYYIKKVNKLLSEPPEGETESQIAARCYGNLRSALELLVENHVLHSTVKRYKKNVSLDRFVAVSGELIEKHKVALNSIYDRCCVYFEGHSNPQEVVSEANLEEFKIDFEMVKEIKKEFP